MAAVLGGAERALGVAVAAVELDLAGVPVHRDGEVVADLLGLGAGVTAALVVEGRGAAGAAEELAVKDQRAVVDVNVGPRAGVFDVDASTGDGLGHGDNSAELEDPGLHDETGVLCFNVRRERDDGDEGRTKDWQGRRALRVAGGINTVLWCKRERKGRGRGGESNLFQETRVVRPLYSRSLLGRRGKAVVRSAETDPKFVWKARGNKGLSSQSPKQRIL